MKNKFLIGGSAVAVVVLVLASFSPVVGYNSVESSAKESPLFAVRTRRAINEESKDTIVCNYVGKDKVINILFPARNEKKVLIQKVLNIITQFDHQELDEFIKSVIGRQYHNKHANDEILKNFVIDDLESFLSETSHTADTLITLCFWFPGCVPYFILATIVMSLIIISLYIEAFLEMLTLVPCGKCGPYPDTLML